MTLEEKRLKCIKEDKMSFQGVSMEEMVALADLIMDSKTIFVAGWGRAGITGKVLSMDLSQIGIPTYVVSDTAICTPAAKPGDLLVICSHSGTTRSMVVLAERAREHGVDIALVTSDGDSEIAKMAKVKVVIPERSDVEFCDMVAWWSFYHTDVQVMDFVRAIIMERTGQTVDDISRYHNNLE